MLKKTPLILVTNDDGITSPGITALTEAVKELGNVVVVAPDKPQSGVGHSITINSPTLRIQKIKLQEIKNAYSVSGTPVDCVKIALYKILKQKPDICVSGINHGSNVSLNVIYSGTMAATIEGAIEGIPSVGFSLMDDSMDADFSASKNIVKIITAKLLCKGLPPGVCLNVNIPPVQISQLKGIKICRQAKAKWIEKFEERKNVTGESYFWLTGEFKSFDRKKKDTDMWAVQNNFVSVVPVQLDLTNHKMISELKQWKLTL